MAISFRFGARLANILFVSGLFGPYKTGYNTIGRF
jgi:hypothetical protein